MRRSSGESSSHANTACTECNRLLGSSTYIACFAFPFRGGYACQTPMPIYGKMEGMTMLLEEVVADLSALSEDEQDRAARALLAFLDGPEELVM